MNSKLKLPFTNFLKPIQNWIKIIQGKFWQVVSPMQGWRDSSWVLSDRLLGGLVIILIITLPFLENAQTGVIGVASAIALIMLWLTDQRDQATSSAWSPIFTPLLTYWCISLLAAAFSPVKIAALDGLIKLTIYMLAFVAMHRLMGIGWRSLLVATYLVSCFVSSAYGVQQWYLGAPELATWTDPTSDSAGITRVYSFLGNPNLFAGYLMPALPLGVIAAIRWQSWGMKALGILTAAMGVFSLTQTQSRGGLIGLVVTFFALIILLVYWWGKRLPVWTLPAALGSMAGVIAVATIAITPLRNRVFSIFGTADSSNAFRVNVWLSVINMIKARPLLGIGNGNKAFNLIYPLYQRSGYSALGAYSVPLELTVETGIIGVICYGWLVVTILHQGWIALNQLRRDRHLDGLWIIAALATICGMIAHSFFDTVWYRPQVQLLWWLAIALVSSLSANLPYCSPTDFTTSQPPDSET
ncbi:MAG: IctB family putative bicarbonate transporter [Pseudanabaenaceae cyanobacterium bins.39]|nr:IctB family putative bicarbonate transporter [Pseudanabaenaceae cyanobacterium bins.39]